MAAGTHAGSLHEVGYSEVANGALLDNIRRVVCFGFQLARLDIRQVPREYPREDPE